MSKSTATEQSTKCCHNPVSTIFRSLLERLLGARLVYTKGSMARALSFEYLNRQLVWHELSELLLFLLPLLNVARLKSMVLSYLPRIVPSLETSAAEGMSCGQAVCQCIMLPSDCCAGIFLLHVSDLSVECVAIESLEELQSGCLQRHSEAISRHNPALSVAPLR